LVDVLFLFLWLLCHAVSLANCRVGIAADGSIVLSPVAAGGRININGEFVVGGSAVIADNLGITERHLNWAQGYNMARTNSLRYQSFTTNTPQGAVFYTTPNGGNFLIIADSASTTQPIYQWVNASQSFVSTGTLNPTILTSSYQYFSIAGTSYLVASGTASGIASRIYVLNAATNGWSTGTAVGAAGGQSRSITVFATTSASVAGTYFLAQATAGGVGNTIYMWSGSAFSASGSVSLSSNSGQAIEFFESGGSLYALLVQDTPVTQLFKWNSASGNSWSIVQASVCTGPAMDAVSFQSNGNTYVAIASGGSVSQSNVYILQGGSLQLINSFTTDTAQDFELFSVFGEIWLAVANLNANPAPLGSSMAPVIFKWNPNFQNFDLWSTPINFQNTYGWNFYSIPNVNNFLLGAHATTSYLYMLDFN